MRRIVLEAEAKARNDRIETWAAAVFAGVDERDRARNAAAAAEDAVVDGLLGLAGEGLTSSEVADPCELTVAEVQKLTKRRRDANAVNGGAPGGSVGQGQATRPDRAGPPRPAGPRVPPADATSG